MKHVLIRAIVLTVLGMLLLEGALGYSLENVVVNPSFEEVDLEQGTVYGWVNMWAAILEGNAHSGNYCIGFAYGQLIYQEFDPPVPIDSVVLFGFWAKNEEGVKPLSIEVTIDGEWPDYWSIDLGNDVVPVDGKWHFVDLTEWLKSGGVNGSGIARISFCRGGGDSSSWLLDDVYLLVKKEGQASDEGQTTPIPQPPEGEGGESGGFSGWMQHFVKSVVEAARRLLGNPMVLLLLITFIVVMAYYATRRSS